MSALNTLLPTVMVMVMDCSCSTVSGVSAKGFGVQKEVSVTRATARASSLQLRIIFIAHRFTPFVGGYFLDGAVVNVPIVPAAGFKGNIVVSAAQRKGEFFSVRNFCFHGMIP